MRVTVQQPRYLPSLSYIHHLLSVDLVVVFDVVRHHGRVFEHRNKVVCRNETTARWLSLPIDRKDGSTPLIKDMRVHSGWEGKHVDKLLYYYSGHGDLIRGLYKKRGSVFFVDIFLERMDLLFRTVGFPLPRFVRASSLDCQGSGSELLASIIHSVGGATYVSGPNGRNYLNEALFPRVEYHDFEPRPYSRNGNSFIPWLAWIDALVYLSPSGLKGHLLEY